MKMGEMNIKMLGKNTRGGIKSNPNPGIRFRPLGGPEPLDSRRDLGDGGMDGNPFHFYYFSSPFGGIGWMEGRRAGGRGEERPPPPMDIDCPRRMTTGAEERDGGESEERRK